MVRVSNLAEYRRRRTLTQEELAKLSGVSRATIAALEMGHRGAHPRTIERLARVLRVKPQELMEN
jgi:transcriptional regulator with XRE-family HTH domain